MAGATMADAVSDSSALLVALMEDVDALAKARNSRIVELQEQREMRNG
jgi:hypothetical protein